MSLGKSNKIKVLQVSLSLGIGGLEKLLVELAIRLNRENFTSVVCCLSEENDLVGILKKNGIKVFFLPKKDCMDFGLIFKLARLLKQEKVDIIHTHDNAANLYGICAAKLAGVKHVINTEHGFMFIGEGRKKIINRILPLYNKTIACVSEAIRNNLIEGGLPAQKLTVIPNGVDISLYQNLIDENAVRVALGFTLQHFVIVSVGRISEEKNQKMLLDAAKLFLPLIPNAQVIIVGDGPFRSELEVYAQALGIGQVVRFLGTRNDVSAILKSSDCFVNPSNFESFGLAILEAMLCGVPVIATNVGGVGTLVKNQETGVLINIGDVQGLAENIIQVYKKPDYFQKIVAQAKEFAQQNFDISKMVTSYETLYLECFGFNHILSDKDMRVLHLISSGGLFGAEKVMLNLAEQHNNQGIPSWVMNIRNTHNPREELALAAIGRGVPSDAVVSKGRFDPKTIDLLCAFIKKNRITLLHSHNYKANLIGAMAARKAGIPVVATLHGYINHGLKLKFYEAVDRFNLHKFNKVVFVDESLKKWFRPDSIKATVINNGVSSNGFVSYDARLIDNKKITIGTVGRLSIEKGQRYLIEAFAVIAREYPKACLLIVGSGELLSQLQGLSRRLGFESQVRFEGFRSDVERFYRQMDIYVLPSLLEHFPLSVLEAMSFGKPIIATNVGGVPEIVKDGETGILINSGSAEQIAKALNALIIDKEMCNRLGAQAQKLVKEQYSIEKMAEAYIKVYRDVLSLPLKGAHC